MIKAAPGAARQAVGALQAGDTGLDAGAEVAQLAIDPVAFDHVFDPQAGLFVKAMPWTPHAFAAAKLLGVAKPPSAAACRGASLVVY